VYDDRKKLAYWGHAEHFRPVLEAELTPIHPEVPADEKWLQVNLAQQWVTAYEAGRPVFQARAATGAVFSTGDFRTPRGSFQTRRKRPSRHMAGGDLAADDRFDLPGVPWVSYFTSSGVSFHGTYWHNDFGRPRSHGCVNLTPQAAKWIYRWTLPHVPPGEGLVWEAQGTRVEVI
jgi:lipoprotein-anchoring transpeptidase ErfK/SrfK